MVRLLQLCNHLSSKSQTVLFSKLKLVPFFQGSCGISLAIQSTFSFARMGLLKRLCGLGITNIKMNRPKRPQHKNKFDYQNGFGFSSVTVPTISNALRWGDSFDPVGFSTESIDVKQLLQLLTVTAYFLSKSNHGGSTKAQKIPSNGMPRWRRSKSYVYPFQQITFTTKQMGFQ